MQNTIMIFFQEKQNALMQKRSFLQVVNQAVVAMFCPHVVAVLTAVCSALCSAPVRPVKVSKVWPESAPEQRSRSPSPSCGGPGGQVREPPDAGSEDVVCPCAGDDSSCHGSGVVLSNC